MTMTNVKFTGFEDRVLKAMALAEISQDRIEASEMNMDSTVIFWLAVDRDEEIMMRSQAIHVERY